MSVWIQKFHVFYAVILTLVVDPHIDSRGCNPSSRWAYNWSSTINDLLSSYDLNDIWRLHHPSTQAFTWHRPSSSQASRLDMFWVSSFFLPFILSVDILLFFRSDRSYVYLKLSLHSSIRFIRAKEYGNSTLII